MHIFTYSINAKLADRHRDRQGDKERHGRPPQNCKYTNAFFGFMICVKRFSLSMYSSKLTIRFSIQFLMHSQGYLLVLPPKLPKCNILIPTALPTTSSSVHQEYFTGHLP